MAVPFEAPHCKILQSKKTVQLNSKFAKAQASLCGQRGCTPQGPELRRAVYAYRLFSVYKNQFLLKTGLPDVAPQERRLVEREGFEPSRPVTQTLA